jgi:hypothetical protein
MKEGRLMEKMLKPVKILDLERERRIMGCGRRFS